MAQLPISTSISLPDPEHSIDTEPYTQLSNQEDNNHSMNDGSKTVHLDTLSYFERWSFAWVRHFVILRAPAMTECKTEETDHRISSHKIKLELAASNLCSTNVQALQNLYASEENQKGAINTSMLRVCFRLCRNRLLIASAIYILALLFGIIALTVFFDQILFNTNAYLDIVNPFTNDPHSNAQYGTQYLHQVLVYSCAFAMFILIMFFLRFVYSSLVLGVGIMLRNACAGAVYSRCLTTSVQSHVPSYKVLTFCAEDGEVIMEMVTKGSFIVVQTISIAICLTCGFRTIGLYMIWPILGLSFLLLISYYRANASTTNYIKYLSFRKQKMNVVDEFLQQLKTDHRMAETIGAENLYKNRFAAATSSQFWALYRSDRMRPTFINCVASIFLIGCMTFMVAAVSRLNRSTMYQATSIILLLMYFVHNLSAEWSVSMVALLRGIVTINKVKPYLAQLPVRNPIIAPDDQSLKVSIQDATFKSTIPSNKALDMDNELTHIDQQSILLNIPDLQVKRNTIVGITSENVASLRSFVTFLLDQKPPESGSFHQSDGISYYPETPFMIEDCSIRANITFESIGNNYNENIYTEAMSTVGLHLNPEFDSVALAKQSMDRPLLQRISLARAIYEQSNHTILLENPLSSMGVSEIRAIVFEKLLSIGKTVIVISQDENILKHCHEIFLIKEGFLIEFNRSDIKANQAYTNIVQNYQSIQDGFSNKSAGNKLTTANATTEELIIEEKSPAPGITSLINGFENCVLILLLAVYAILYIGAQFFQLFSSFLFIYALGYVIPVTIVAFVLLITINSASKSYVYRKARRFNKRLQRALFQQLLQSSMANVTESQIVGSIYAFLESYAKSFQVRLLSVHHWMLVIFGTVLLFASSSLGCVFGPLVIIQFCALYYSFRNTMTNAGHMESASRQKLFDHIHNEIEGRYVIQSRSRIAESKKRIFELIDSHSADIYLNKSVVYYAQFIFTVCQVVNLPAFLVTLHHINHSKDFAYMLSLYSFLLIVNCIRDLLENRLEKIQVDQKLKLIQELKYGD